MARGDHGLPKVSLGPAMPNPSTPCERATPETTLWGGPPEERAAFYPFALSFGQPTPYV
jgi:hypothetical protein